MLMSRIEVFCTLYSAFQNYFNSGICRDAFVCFYKELKCSISSLFICVCRVQ